MAKIEAAYDRIDGVIHYGYLKGKNQEFIDLGRVPEMTQLYIDMDTEEKGFYFELCSTLEPQTFSHLFSRGDFTPRNEKTLETLMRLGFEVDGSSYSLFCKVIEDLRNGLPPEKIVYRHRSLGWTNMGDSFLGSRVISNDSTVKETIYYGKYAIQAGGSWEKRQQFIREEILGRPKLELDFLIGLSAVVNGYLSWYEDVTCPIFHLYGDSTTGKTTALVLAVSAAGDPFGGSRKKPASESMEKSLLQSWNSTVNAIEGTLAGNHGMIMAFDELGAKTADIGNLVYVLANGISKSRLNMQQPESFGTTILSSGECTVSDVLKQEVMGEKMRICEIAGPFTDDADHAERIKSNCKANFGFETMILAKHILEKGSAYVLDLFEQSREEYLSKVKTVSSKWQRRSKLTGGLILLTAKLVSEAVGYTFQTDRICDILLEADAWLEDKGDIGMQALKMVEEWVENNLQHFIISKKGSPDSCEEVPANGTAILGKYYSADQAGVKDFAIYPARLEAFLKEKGLSKDNLIKIWKKRGILIAEAGKNTIRRNIEEGGKKGRKSVYYFSLAADSAASEEQTV